MPFLVSLNPALMHREFDLSDGEVVVGRDASSCEVIVTGHTISRRHCRIVPGPGGAWAIEDLQSTNGTFVNGRRVPQAVLSHRDVISLGDANNFALRFQAQRSGDGAESFLLPAQDRWMIGRAAASDISLPFEAMVSFHHAELRRSGDCVEVRDLGSLNGTFVSGVRVRHAVVEPGDVVTVGSTALRVEPAEGGALRVVSREIGKDISLECVGLVREVANHRRLLDEIALSIRPGEFVGLLGPSGAGKSTLLKALNGYAPPTSGCVLVNETPLHRSIEMFRSAIGYVPQDDIVHTDLTVRQSLDFVARLRLPADVTRRDRLDLVDTTIETLGLSHVAASRIHQLSGGQRKRVSIGCELITRPGILFLDEPTSGLDPSTEERLMRHFREMTRLGSTILITTHILYSLDLLDRVVILSRGKLVFFGTPAEALVFFGDAQPLERATQIFDLLEGIQPGQETAPSPQLADERAAEYQRRFLESPLYRRHVRETCSPMAAHLHEVMEQGGPAADVDGTHAIAGRKGRSYYESLLRRPRERRRRFAWGAILSPRLILTQALRHIAVKLASPRRALLYLAIPIILALVTLTLRVPGSLSNEEADRQRAEIAESIDPRVGPGLKSVLSPNPETDERDAAQIVYAIRYEGPSRLPVSLSVLVMFVMTAVFTGTLMSCLDISTERSIYLRERLAGLRIADYLTSKLPFLFAVLALQSGIFLGLCLLKPGLHDVDVLGVFLALLAMSCTAGAMGLFLSALDPTPGQFSVVLALVAVLPQLVLSGGLAPDFYGGMAAPLRWLADAFPARWGLEMLMTACYDQPHRESLAWTGAFVTDMAGFRFGTGVYTRSLVALALQTACWLLLTGAVLRRLDHRR